MCAARLSNLTKLSIYLRLRSLSLNTMSLHRIFNLFDSNLRNQFHLRPLSALWPPLLLGHPADVSTLLSPFLHDGSNCLDFDAFCELHCSLGDTLSAGGDEWDFGNKNKNQDDKNNYELHEEALQGGWWGRKQLHLQHGASDDVRHAGAVLQSLRHNRVRLIATRRRRVYFGNFKNTYEDFCHSGTALIKSSANLIFFFVFSLIASRNLFCFLIDLDEIKLEQAYNTHHSYFQGHVNTC